MIAEFNRGQVFEAAEGLAGSAVFYALTWVFLQRVAMALLEAFNFSATHATWLSWLMVIVMTLSGWQTWKSGQGFENYGESVFSPDLTGSDETMWARKMDNPGQELRGTAYVLSQLFLSGPLLMLKSLERLKSRMPTRGWKGRERSGKNEQRALGRERPHREPGVGLWRR